MNVSVIVGVSKLLGGGVFDLREDKGGEGGSPRGCGGGVFGEDSSVVSYTGAGL